MSLGRYLNLVLLALICGFSVSSINPPARAAEDATGIYLLGSKSSMAGFVPPPGTYFSMMDYYYTGSASGAAAAGVALNQVGNITVQADIDVDADAFIKLPTLLWITPHKILGGNLGFGVIGVVGWKDVDVDVDALTTLTLANGTRLQRGARFSFGDDTFDFGDPLITALIGWHQGNWHWNVSGLLNIPVANYDSRALANIAFNRWAFDVTGAATWLDPTRSHEASVAAGFTFNGENPDTNYETGTEFHVEFALMQHFSKTFAAGVAGYHYNQVTGDSGRGATLGAFEGRVTAIGPNINYSFVLGQTPVSTSLRWLHEFDAANRLEGDSVLFSATMPLGSPER
ncbi:MAG: transporter [Hyphomicrobiaceae bacterium]|nr:transporter [Hyphomicrobiaceae bacterium]